MKIELKKTNRKPGKTNSIYLISNLATLNDHGFEKKEIDFIRKEARLKTEIIEINRYSSRVYVLVYKVKNNQQFEDLRVLGNKLLGAIIGSRLDKITLVTQGINKNFVLAFIEGMLLGNYQFLKYKTNNNKKENTLRTVTVYSPEVTNEEISELVLLSEAVYFARDLVNEPDSYLTAEKLAEKAQEAGKETGADVDVFNKRKIESLKMGGLLAVNRGSINPPTFTIYKWNPKNAINKKPYILVGKGIVYDTGGLSLKPSNFMDTMKCDMAGAAAVVAAMYAISKAKLPVYVIGLIPATDNRPDGNAYTPGDVVKMYDGSTVEVLNTDAEGRMILADALHYAKKFEPELVIDIATLTGAASRAIGSQAMVGMKVKSDREFKKLVNSGYKVHERIVEFPMWDEYADQLKSDIADQKNIGGAEAGAITAGKFLEHFTDYPYIHLDIAGPAFLSKANSYRTSGGTGIGVRLFYDFIKSKTE